MLVVQHPGSGKDKQTSVFNKDLAQTLCTSEHDGLQEGESEM
jgi:hypothetical protein